MCIDSVPFKGGARRGKIMKALYFRSERWYMGICDSNAPWQGSQIKRRTGPGHHPGLYTRLQCPSDTRIHGLFVMLLPNGGLL